MPQPPPFDRTGLRAGIRLAVAVSGGADSVGLLRALAEAASHIGLVLSVAHLHHGIRAAAADEDAAFVAALAQSSQLTLHLHHVAAPEHARVHRQSLEEAARELRYSWFRDLIAQGKVDAVATAHTLDDQAETVLHRLLRGAWTEGLGGIHPIVTCAQGAILRPFLSTRRPDIVAWLTSIGQPWREDESNQDPAFTRNRIRHELLPQMAGFNPRIAEQLAHLAAIARDEEDWWEAELRRLLPGLLLPGKPVRGGGRAVSTHPEQASAAIEWERLRSLPPALRRRVLRAAAQQIGGRLGFEETERLMAMCAPDAPRREQLSSGLRAERSARELRLIREATPASPPAQRAVEAPIPGQISALGVVLRLTLSASSSDCILPPATLRAPRPGDRVSLLHARGAKSLKEIFERLNIETEARKTWPLLEWQGRIVWMKDVPLDLDPPIPFRVEFAASDPGS